jgi:thiol-disulfide isomerase/thioredoxin
MATRFFNIAQFSLLGLLLLLSGCDEQRRVIEPFVPTGDRVVLLEEFTGKGCTNCPKGSREIDNLLLQYPNNLVVVSIHAGFFADPEFFPVGVYDLRADQSAFLIDYLKPILGYPSGVVDRSFFGGDLQIGLQQWASAISSEIQVPPSIEVNIDHTYDEETRQLTLTVSGIGKADESGEVRLSIMLTESGIVDAQDDFEAGGIVDDYVHKHVLRDMLTPSAGETLFQDIYAGKTYSNEYVTTINSDWVADSMEIVAFISLVNGNDVPVLQAASAHLTE